jgi:hypothetical protein
MATPKITPINRSNKFFGEEDFNLDIQMGREAIEGDGNFTIVLYRVDRQMSQFDDLYGEAVKDGIRWMPPIELKVVPIHAEPENKVYNDNGTGRYLQDGQFTFAIYVAQLAEEEVDIRYGDYVGYAVTEKEMRFFSVVNDGKKNWDNKHTIVGYKGAFRTVICAPVDSSEFRGI